MVQRLGGGHVGGRLHRVESLQVPLTVQVRRLDHALVGPPANRQDQYVGGEDLLLEHPDDVPHQDVHRLYLDPLPLPKHVHQLLVGRLVRFVPLIVLVRVLDGRHPEHKSEACNRRRRGRRGHARDQHDDALQQPKDVEEPPELPKEIERQECEDGVLVRRHLVPRHPPCGPAMLPTARRRLAVSIHLRLAHLDGAEARHHGCLRAFIVCVLSCHCVAPKRPTRPPKRGFWDWI
mmetsp:Transcript_1144/g.2691  ORF Transcript_1144/g.2691 Transcript_1144/m.2691 type:complete len:234 (+) Transcript_1144:3350-4051(+)